MSPVAINERVHRNRQTDDARLLRERTLRLLRTEIEFISNKSFRTIDRELEREVLAGETSFEVATSPVPKSLPSHLARLCETSVLTPEQEQELFRQMNYLKFRANALRSRLNPHEPDESMVVKVECLLRAAQAVRDQLVKANMRLAISIVKKFVTPRNSFDDMLSDGIYSLIQAVDKFDYDRGFRFSTYAYRAIARNAYRAILKRQQESARSVDEVNESNLDSATARPESAMDVQTWMRLRGLLSQMMGHLDRREQLIIRCRYALGAHRKVKTFQTIADRLGVSKERVRQLEQRAMTKLRTLAAQLNMDELLGASLS
ncbi:MAG: sigma-70 family RNA polymerase sigma factor [Pirellulaceae bacterium]|jgi:RNA polymerase primary sigma factor|nr:sigma-70 family RNA polymerase sigma factor [Pirellulaceae bacterium]